MGEKDQKRTNTTLQDVSSSTPTASQGTNEQRVSKKTRTTGMLALLTSKVYLRLTLTDDLRTILWPPLAVEPCNE